MLVHPQFDPVALSLGPVQIHWYGLTYLVAFGLFLWLASRRVRYPWLAEAGWTRRDVEDLLFYGVVGVVVGGRIGYALFYKPGHYAAHPLEVLAVWQGGMSFHGGLLGVLAAMALFARSRSRTFLQVTDVIAPCVPTGLASGRIGNFINGELWGRAADPSLPWAMVFPQSGSDMPRHPSQLYQFALEGLLLFVLLWWYASKPRATGMVSGAFLFGYGMLPLHRRILPRARQLPRPARIGPEPGPMAEPADDRRRHRPVVVGARARRPRNMSAMRQIFLDTETTGLNAEGGDRIIEIGCVEMIGRRLTGDNRHFYLNPQPAQPPRCAARARPDRGVPGRQAAVRGRGRRFAGLSGGCRVGDPQRALRHRLSRRGIASLCRKPRVAEVAAQVTDSLLMAREMFPGKSNSLDALCKRLEVDNSSRALHGALLDAGLLAEVYICMTRGQGSLVIEEGEARDAAGGVETIDLSGFELPIILPSDEEMAAHRALLAEIARASSGQAALAGRSGIIRSLSGRRRRRHSGRLAQR